MIYGDIEQDDYPFAGLGDVVVYYWAGESSVRKLGFLDIVVQPSFGHIAIEVMRYSDSPLYISFWPGTCRSINNDRIDDGYLCRAEGSHFHTRNQDDYIYGNKIPQRIVLTSLNAAAITQRYQAFIQHDYHWSIFGSLIFVNQARSNCSGLVYDLINAGLHEKKVSILTRVKFAWRWNALKTLPVVLAISPIVLYAAYVFLKRVKETFAFNFVSQLKNESDNNPVMLMSAYTTQYLSIKHSEKTYTERFGLMLNVIDSYAGNTGLAICIIIISLAVSYVSRGTLGSASRSSVITPKDVHEYVTDLSESERSDGPSALRQTLFYGTLGIAAVACIWGGKTVFGLSESHTSMGLRY